MAGTPRTVRQDDDGVDVAIAERDGRRPQRRCARDYVVGCDGSRSTVREQAGITQTPVGPRPADGAAGVPLARAARAAASAIPASRSTACCIPTLEGYWKFFGRVDLGSTWFFHAPVPAGHHARQLRLPPLPRTRRPAPTFDVEFEHIGFWELRFAMADAYRSRPRLHRRRRRAQPSALRRLRRQHRVSRTRATSAGSSPPRCRAGAATACSTPTTPSGGRCSRRRRATSSRRPSTPTASSCAASIPQRDRAAFERAWQRAARARSARSRLRAATTRARRSCGAPPDGRCSARRLACVRGAARATTWRPQPLSSGRNVFEELGEGFTLLALDGDDDRLPRLSPTLPSELRVPLKIVARQPRGGRERYEAAYVLVRPDQFVAWAGDGSAGGNRPTARAAPRHRRDAGRGCARRLTAAPSARPQYVTRARTAVGRAATTCRVACRYCKQTLLAQS